MSPEQIKGERDVDERSDIYSLGVTFYEMLAGRAPFESDADSESDYFVRKGHVELPPPDPREFYPAIPGRTVDVLMRALAKDSDERFQSATEMREAIDTATAPAGVPVKPLVVPSLPVDLPEHFQPASSMKAPNPRGRYLLVGLVVGIGLLIVVVMLVNRTPKDQLLQQSPAPTIAEDLSKSVTSAGNKTNSPLVTIRQALANEQWDNVLASCQKLTPEQQLGVKETCQRAAQEKEASVLFEEFHSAATRNAFLKAVRYQNRIPSTSVYKNKNLQMLADAKTKYLAQAYKELDEQLKKGKCIKAGAIADQIQEVNPRDHTVTDKVKNCSAGGDVVAVKAPTKPRRDPKLPKPRTEPKPEPEHKPTGSTLAELKEAKKIVHWASQSYVAGNHVRAIQLAKKALKLAGGQKMAIQIVGASSCYMKKARDAKWAYRLLPPQQRNLLKKVCQKNGVNLELRNK